MQECFEQRQKMPEDAAVYLEGPYSRNLQDSAVLYRVDFSICRMQL